MECRADGAERHAVSILPSCMRTKNRIASLNLSFKNQTGSVVQPEKT
jgi:hypothetical protein